MFMWCSERVSRVAEITFKEGKHGIQSKDASLRKLRGKKAGEQVAGLVWLMWWNFARVMVPRERGEEGEKGLCV